MQTEPTEGKPTTRTLFAAGRVAPAPQPAAVQLAALISAVRSIGRAGEISSEILHAADQPDANRAALSDLATAVLTGESPGPETACTACGHRGRLLRMGVYARHPEPLWHGMGDCEVCGSTIHGGGEG